MGNYIALYVYLCPNEACKNQEDVKIPIKELETTVVRCSKCDTISERQIQAMQVPGSSWSFWRR